MVLPINYPHILLSDDPSVKPPSKSERTLVRDLVDKKITDLAWDRYFGISRDIPPVGHLFDSRKKTDRLPKSSMIQFIPPTKTKPPSVVRPDANEEDVLSQAWEKVSNSDSQRGSEDGWQEI